MYAAFMRLTCLSSSISNTGRFCYAKVIIALLPTIRTQIKKV